jgi:hypothetical protein
MSGMHSRIGRRHRLATSILVGAIGILLPASAGATNAHAARIGAAATAPVADDTSIRPFQFHASDEALADLRRRIAATKWPWRETVSDATQGVRLATMRELARYWATDYNWRKAEARLNAYPQFITVIDGLPIHFIHVKRLSTAQTSIVSRSQS